MTEEVFEKAPLTPWDEYPAHATPYPLSYIPATDYAWDDGYYFLAYDLETGRSILNGMRIAPNSNMVGGHSCFNLNGVQRQLRISRVWRDDFSISCGPLRYEVLEPLKRIRNVLEPNESGMSYDFIWEAVGPAHLVAHHRAIRNGRRNTDQSRYYQVGIAYGWMELDGKRTHFTKDKPWAGSRDHSWGLYENRPPLGPHPGLLAPVKNMDLPRALRFSFFLQSEGFSAFYQFHEGPDGERQQLNDPFGTPLEGWITQDGDAESVRVVDYTHDLRWRPGTRSVTSGVVTLTDEDGGVWTMEITVATPPHVLGSIGYHQGAWTDGGTINTYHGRSPALEWEEFDYSIQPCERTFSNGERRSLFGVEHLARVRTSKPDGGVAMGRAHFSVFLNGRYSPYGFRATGESHGLSGRGLSESPIAEQDA